MTVVFPVVRSRVGRTITSYAAAAIAVSLPWPLLLVLAWDQYGATAHGALAVGLVGAARMAPYVLLSWAVGSLGDRVRRDRLVAVTLALRLVLLLAMAAALAAGLLVVAVLVTALAVACGTPAYPAIAASIPGLAGRGHRRATEALVTIEVGAWVVGPALGGLLLMPLTREWVPVVAVALMGVAAILARGVALPSPPAQCRAAATVSAMFAAVRRSPVAVGALATAALLNVVGSATAVTLLPLTRDAWGRGDAAFGLATACLGFGALGAPLLWGVRASSRTRRAGGLLCLGLAVVLVGVSSLPTVSLIVLAVAGAVTVMVESAVTQTIQHAVADEHRAGALGLGDSVMVGGALVGALVAPVLAAAVGARATLVICGAACLLAAAACARRRLPSEYTALSEPTNTQPLAAAGLRR